MSSELKTRIKEVMIKSLRLPMSPSDIADDMQLFGGGLGLDSIDALELVLEIERTFGVAIADDANARLVLRSVNTLAEFITSQSPGCAV